MCLVGVDYGSELTGTLVYDTSEIDTEPNPSFGYYLFDTPPTKMIMKVGAQEFRTSTTNMSFFVTVIDSMPGQGADKFYVFDDNPSEVLRYLSTEYMWLWLADSTGTSLESDSLPLGIILDDWNEKKLVEIGGTDFTIVAEITETSVVGIPIISRSGAIILIVGLLSVGAAILIRR
jgi:hypothetical protein